MHGVGIQLEIQGIDGGCEHHIERKAEACHRALAREGEQNKQHRGQRGQHGRRQMHGAHARVPVDPVREGRAQQRAEQTPGGGDEAEGGIAVAQTLQIDGGKADRGAPGHPEAGLDRGIGRRQSFCLFHRLAPLSRESKSVTLYHKEQGLSSGSAAPHRSRAKSPPAPPVCRKRTFSSGAKAPSRARASSPAKALPVYTGSSKMPSRRASSWI